MKLFYSWQSDIKHQKSIIEKSINMVLEKIKEENIMIDLDQDTKDKPGSVDIAQEIWNKINSASIFIGDITFINVNIFFKFFSLFKLIPRRKLPNPNVLLELGFAARKLGWERIILIFNKKYGEINELPLDLNHHRVLPYSGNIKELGNDIYKSIKEIIPLGDKIINRDRDEEHDIAVFNRIMKDIPEENLEDLFSLIIANKRYKYDDTRFILDTNSKINLPKNTFINEEIQKKAYDFGYSLDLLSSFMAINFFPDKRDVKFGQLRNFESKPYPECYELLDNLLNELSSLMQDAFSKFRDFRFSVKTNLGI